MSAEPPFLKKTWPGIFGLAHENHIRQIAKIILLHSYSGAANNDEGSPPFQFAQNLAHAETLYDHPGEADHIGLGQAVKIQGFDILIEQSDVVARRRERC